MPSQYLPALNASSSCQSLRDTSASQPEHPSIGALRGLNGPLALERACCQKTQTSLESARLALDNKNPPLGANPRHKWRGFYAPRIWRIQRNQRFLAQKENLFDFWNKEILRDFWFQKWFAFLGIENLALKGGVFIIPDENAQKCASISGMPQTPKHLSASRQARFSIKRIASYSCPWKSS